MLRKQLTTLTSIASVSVIDKKNQLGLVLNAETLDTAKKRPMT